MNNTMRGGESSIKWTVNDQILRRPRSVVHFTTQALFWQSYPSHEIETHPAEYYSAGFHRAPAGTPVQLSFHYRQPRACMAPSSTVPSGSWRSYVAHSNRRVRGCRYHGVA